MRRRLRSPPAPAVVYSKFAELSGDRNFATACAALQFENASPTPVSATNFGDGLALAYAAASQTWTVTGDYLPTLTFGPADADAAAPAAPTRAYAKVVDGFTTRLTVGVPTPGDVALDYGAGWWSGRCVPARLMPASINACSACRPWPPTCRRRASPMAASQ